MSKTALKLELFMMMDKSIQFVNSKSKKSLENQLDEFYNHLVGMVIPANEASRKIINHYLEISDLDRYLAIANYLNLRLRIIKDEESRK